MLPNFGCMFLQKSQKSIDAELPLPVTSLLQAVERKHKNPERTQKINCFNESTLERKTIELLIQNSLHFFKTTTFITDGHCRNKQPSQAQMVVPADDCFQKWPACLTWLWSHAFFKSNLFKKFQKPVFVHLSYRLKKANHWTIQMHLDCCNRLLNYQVHDKTDAPEVIAIW